MESRSKKCNIFDVFMVHKNAKILYNIDVTNILKGRERFRWKMLLQYKVKWISWRKKSQ